MFEFNLIQETNRATHCELQDSKLHDACDGPLSIYQYLPMANWPDTLRCAHHGAMLMEGWVVKF